MISYLRKGYLRFTPEDIGIPFNIYDMGTYHAAVEVGSSAQDILDALVHRLSLNLKTRCLNKDALGKLEEMGLIKRNEAGTHEELLRKTLESVSFGPGKKSCDNEVYEYIDFAWMKDGLYQKSFTTLKVLEQHLEIPQKDIEDSLVLLIKSDLVIPYDIEPRYSQELYKDIKTMPFIVYTEKMDITGDVLKKIFKKEAHNVS